MKSIIKIKDNIKTEDNFNHNGFVGEWIFGKGLKHVPYTDPYGNKCYRSEFEEELYRDHNIVVIGGYQYTFSKLFNIEMDSSSTLRVGELNDEAPQMKIGVQRSEYLSDASRPAGVNISALNHIFGFMVGDGGATENNITAISPSYKRRTLFRAVPFRMSNDGSTIDESKYFGKSFTSSSSNMLSSYYIKKFDIPSPHIIHVWAADSSDELNTVDDSVYASISTTPVESYVEINMSLDDDDCRGFFNTISSIARVNEFALVSGWYNSEKNDYEKLVMFSHFTRPSILLDQDDSIKIIYRLYAR